MKFEKLNENKIKITVSIQDLKEKDISLHDFMSNSIETQDLFFDLLEEADEKVGFKVNDCKVKVEAFAMTEEDFILTITKTSSNSKNLPRKKLKVRKKTNSVKSNEYIIYKFNTFDDFCNFSEFLIKNNLKDSYKVAETAQLFLYKNFYYLVFHNINENYKKLSTFYTLVTEFGSYVLNPNLFVYKLNESGSIFVKNNALKKSFTYFIKIKNLL